MPIKAVVFDIGGVLEFNPDTGWRKKWQERLHLSIEDLDQRLKDMGRDGSLGTCSEAEWLDGLCEITGIDQGQADDFMKDLWEEYVGTLNVELASFFSNLRPRYQTAILSNSFIGARDREESLYHFEEMTDLIVYSHEVGLAKPDRRIYALTCERLGVRPEEMVFLDDLTANIAAAHEFGIHGILFTETSQAIADVRACLQMNGAGH